MSGAPRPAYRLFEVVGIELEYPIVDADLRPVCLVEPAFRRINGRPTSDLEHGAVGFSNEFAAHVFELKTLDPQRSLAQAERQLVEGLRHFAGVLDREFGARLLPTAMHPFMRPEDTGLWPRGRRRIYRTYHRIFNARGHGWLNVQASHVNLPFGAEPETVMMHNAVACLLPYLPALAASSPIYEGRLGPYVDNRMAFYRGTQRRIPIITADVIPEYVHSYREYRSRILKRIYRSLDAVPGGEVIQHEWVNSRGAIMRFMRRALEIRVLDMQECIKADVAVAVFVRAALRALVRDLRTGELVLPPRGMLVRDFNRVIRHGRAAPVAASHLLPRRGNPRAGARAVLEALLDRAEPHVPAAERTHLDLIAERLRRGNLSERIAARVRRDAPRAGTRRRDAIRAVYEELASALTANEPWLG